MKIKMWMAALLLIVSLPGRQFEIQNLAARAGGQITLPTRVTGLRGDHVLWYLYSSKETLIFCYNGKVERHPPKRFEGRFHVDQTTGSLTIQPLSVKDSGVYQGEIIDGNNKKTYYTYNVTVSAAKEACCLLMADGSTPNTAADQRKNHLAVVAVIVGIVLFV